MSELQETEKKIKVLLVAPLAPPMGGQAVQAKRILTKLQTEKTIQIEFQPINPPFFPRLQKIKYLRTLLTESKYIFDLIRKIPTFDVIHIFSAGDSGFVISTMPAIYVAKFFKKKTILNYRHGGAEEHFNTWKKTALGTIKMFDRIVVPSQFLVGVFAKFGLSATSIFNFVDEEKYIFQARKSLKPIFLSNRNFEELYNISCTIKAFAIIQEKLPEAKLLLIGDGPERKKLEHLVTELKLKNVEFIGQIPAEKMPEMYGKADVYLNSPNIDNMPNSIIEAFACGIPVISTNAGGIPFIVENGKTGFLVDVNDHQGLANRAINLLEDNELAQKITSNAYTEVTRYFWANIRSQWLQIYSEVNSKKS